MARVNITSTVEEEDETLISLPNLSSPLLKEDDFSPFACKFAESSIKIKREKYRISKINSTPNMNKFSLRGKSKLFNIESEYKFLETLGVGTYGEVKLASYVSDSTKFVAIKIAKGQTSIHLLRNEAEILKKLNHECFPNFVDFKIDEISNKAYLIMEYFKGKTLDQYLEEQKFSEEKALSHIITLVNAIKYLHFHKIAHRDLKPQNVIITHDDQVKIIDFNVSKKFVARSSESDNFKVFNDNSKFEQKFFTQICSPLFAAPEIFSTDCYSESIDIWGLGVIFLSMLRGIELFNQCELKTLNQNELIEVIKSTSPEISDDSIRIVSMMLSTNPEDRPAIEELSSLFEE